MSILRMLEKEAILFELGGVLVAATMLSLAAAYVIAKTICDFLFTREALRYCTQWSEPSH